MSSRLAMCWDAVATSSRDRRLRFDGREEENQALRELRMLEALTGRRGLDDLGDRILAYRRIRNEVQATGDAGPAAARRPGRRPVVPFEVFRAHVAAHKNVNKQQRARMLTSELGRPVSRDAVYRLFRRLETEAP